ncbi:MAG: hypothetical protein PHT33_01980 [bacterium]|nr:hypothetical protein [bacterium]
MGSLKPTTNNQQPTTALEERSLKETGRYLHNEIAGASVYGVSVSDGSRNRPEAPWRVSPQPFRISPGLYSELQALGEVLLSFYKACNKLYYDSVRGLGPAWIAGYADKGKPEEIIGQGIRKRWRQSLPAVIRPDLILTEDGYIICELDSLPGGMGMTSAMTEAYASAGWGRSEIDIPGCFAAAVAPDNGMLAVVVSDESSDYRPEMEYLVSRLADKGCEAVCVRPDDIIVDGEVRLRDGRHIDSIYRFFELFDLDNVSGGSDMIQAAASGRVAMTPPPKAFLEEKLWLALLHHPLLERYWHSNLEDYDWMKRLVPQGWVLDGRPVPPHAVIPGLSVGNRPVGDWALLGEASQKERRLVLKPSGFSPLAWGSHGLHIGHDMPASEWTAALQQAASGWEQDLYILQRFHQGRRFNLPYYSSSDDDIKWMDARVRLCPYYFVIDGRAVLGGIMSTACSLEKKAVHGMPEAIIAPALVVGEEESDA